MKQYGKLKPLNLEFSFFASRNRERSFGNLDEVDNQRKWCPNSTHEHHMHMCDRFKEALEVLRHWTKFVKGITYS